MSVELGEDRKQRNRRTETELVRTAAIALAVPPLVLAVLAGVLTRNILIALVVLLVVAGGLVLWAWTALRGYAEALVGRAGSAIADDAQPRLHNIVEGLCVAHGLTKPALIGTAGPGRNIAAITVGWGSTATNALVVSTPLLDSLSRIELEGVIARELGLLQDGTTSLGTLVAALGSTPPFSSILGGRLAAAIDPDTAVLADVAGVRLTRYPPGLAAALDTLGTGSTQIASADAASAHLWFADPLAPTGAPGESASLEVRAATLREL